MKNRILTILSAFFAVLFLFTACKKDDPIKLDAQMDTWGVRNITSTSAELSGIVVANGAGYSEYGVCWSTSENPTVDDAKTSLEKPDGAVYWIEATGLEHLTKYYSRAYAITSNGTVTYGFDTTFTTLANIATVTVAEVTNIAGKTATSGGDVTYDGKAAVTAKGICWSTAHEPTIEDNVVEGGDGLGEFVCNISGLNGASTYYVRAFATNKMGTAYSDEVSFTTLGASPSLTTDSIINITKTTFDAYGTVVVDGGATVTERGFCWATSEDPTLADDNMAATAGGLGSFNVSIENLDPGTEYYVRAYATNSNGTEYGENIRVKTVTDIQMLYVPGGYQAASGYGDGDWTPSTAPFIINTTDNKVLEGYIYFAGAAEFKLTTDPDWDHTNYGAGAVPGTLDPAGSNMSVTEGGYYRIKADLVALTYSVEKMDWRLIGDGVGGWDSDKVNMVYNSSLKRLFATFTFSAGSFKMRANGTWDDGYNFGDNGANGSLEYGGDNIASTAATFTFMADLSQRNYSGMLTSWGIIGDAAGGWSDDVNMTPNVNNTWTYTGAFTAGSYKFRANDGWDVNLGGSIDKLSFDGDNLSIATAGTYTIVLDLTDGTCTVTPAK
jgi:hypothetical protein